MPTYFFDIHNDEITLDSEGIDLPDEAAALERAHLETRALAAESVRAGHLVRSHRVDVFDSARNRIGSVRFEDAVRIE